MRRRDLIFAAVGIYLSACGNNRRLGKHHRLKYLDGRTSLVLDIGSGYSCDVDFSDKDGKRRSMQPTAVGKIKKWIVVQSKTDYYVVPAIRDGRSAEGPMSETETRGFLEERSLTFPELKHI